MKIKVNKGQYKQLVNEVGGYDDPTIGASDEGAIMKSLIENYFQFREAMDNLSELVPAIVVQDRLKNDLGNIRNSLVEPMNQYSQLMLKLKGQSQDRPEDDFPPI
jgi:hypothetical protein